MSADNGLTLKRVKSDYADQFQVLAWQGESEGEIIFTSNDVMEALIFAENEMSPDPMGMPSYEYGLYLGGFKNE